jgi:hypothetical protein
MFVSGFCIVGHTSCYVGCYAGGLFKQCYVRRVKYISLASYILAGPLTVFDLFTEKPLSFPKLLIS